MDKLIIEELKRMQEIMGIKKTITEQRIKKLLNEDNPRTRLLKMLLYGVRDSAGKLTRGTGADKQVLKDVINDTGMDAIQLKKATDDAHNELINAIRTQDQKEINKILEKIASQTDLTKLIRKFKDYVAKSLQEGEKAYIDAINSYKKEKGEKVTREIINNARESYKKSLSQVDFLTDDPALIERFADDFYLKMETEFADDLGMKAEKELSKKTDDVVDNASKKADDTSKKADDVVDDSSKKADDTSKKTGETKKPKTDEELAKEFDEEFNARQGEIIEELKKLGLSPDMSSFIIFPIRYLRIYLFSIFKSKAVIEDEIYALLKKIKENMDNGKVFDKEAFDLATKVLMLKKSQTQDLLPLVNKFIRGKDLPKGSKDLMTQQQRFMLEKVIKDNPLVEHLLIKESQRVAGTFWANMASRIAARVEFIPVLRALSLQYQKKWKAGVDGLWRAIAPSKPEDLQRLGNFIVWGDTRSVKEISQLMAKEGIKTGLRNRIIGIIFANFIVVPLIKSYLGLLYDSVKTLFSNTEWGMKKEKELLEEFCKAAKDAGEPDACDDIDFKNLKLDYPDWSKEIGKRWKANLPVWGSKSSVPPDGYMGIDSDGWSVIAKNLLCWTYIDETVNFIANTVPNPDNWKIWENDMNNFTSRLEQRAQNELIKVGLDPNKPFEEQLKNLKERAGRVYENSPAGYSQFLIDMGWNDTTKFTHDSPDDYYSVADNAAKLHDLKKDRYIQISWEEGHFKSSIMN